MTKQTQVRSTEEAPARSALKLALEVLESAEPKYTRQRKDQKTLGGALDYWKLAQHQRLKAITALREALAEQPKESPKFDPNESFAREEAAQARVREFMRNH